MGMGFPGASSGMRIRLRPPPPKLKHDLPDEDVDIDKDAAEPLNRPPIEPIPDERPNRSLVKEITIEEKTFAPYLSA
jgi:hypothetical protein